jgi:hypothetical protein
LKKVLSKTFKNKAGKTPAKETQITEQSLA